MTGTSTPTVRRSGLFDRVIARAARLLARGVYRSVEVYNPESGWEAHPVVLVANHPTGFSDPALLLALLGRPPRFLAKATLWNVPGMGWFLDRLGAIPVYRAQDGATDRNTEMFGAAYQALAEGGTVALFPEGRATEAAHLVPIRTGVSRIVLGAYRSGVRRIEVVPVGIHYEDQAAIRRRAYVRVGDVLDVDREVADIVAGEPLGVEDHRAVELLTQEIEQRLARVAPDFSDDEQAKALSFAAEVTLRDPEGRHVAYGARQRVAGAVARKGPDAAVPIADAATAYRTDLGAAGVRDEDLFAADHPPRTTWRFFVMALLMTLLVPLALVGAVLNAIPYLLLTSAVRLRSRVMAPPTIRLVVATVAFGLTWLAWALLAGWVGNWRLGLVVFAACPLYGAIAVGWLDRAVTWWRGWRGRRRVGAMGSTVDQLRRTRAALVSSVEATVSE